MTDKQPEALSIADWLESMSGQPYPLELRPAAAELRRLHEVNAELLEVLQDLAWYADMCVAFLKETHPGKSKSLNGRVKKAADVIAKATGEQQ